MDYGFTGSRDQDEGGDCALNFKRRGRLAWPHRFTGVKQVR